MIYQIVKCPYCGRKIKAVLKSNRWVRWIETYCSECEYRKNIENLDFLQPSSPFFKAIYGHDPIEEAMQKKRNREWEENNFKDNREIEMQLRVKKGLLKPWHKKDIIKYARENKLE